MSIIMHVDLDAFYASVEMRRRPELRDQPMYVGGGHRGVVLSANYAARRHGIHGGMSNTQAHRLCPQAVVVRPDFDAYEQVSNGVFAILDTISDKVESASIDEAYLDITGAVKRLATPSRIGEQVRAMVADEQGITCSIGIAPGKLWAKLACGQAKPDGLLELATDQVVPFVRSLDVADVTGIGPKTAAMLRSLGLHTMADVAAVPQRTLERAFGPAMGRWLCDISHGRDDSTLQIQPREHTIGTQSTFARDTDDADEAAAAVLGLCAQVAARLRRAGVLGDVVTLTVRYANFTTVSRRVTLVSGTDVTSKIYAAALSLFPVLGVGRQRIRLVGIRMGGLVPMADAVWQPALDEPEIGWREAEVATDAIVTRFGPDAIRRATLTRARQAREGSLLHKDRIRL